MNVRSAAKPAGNVTYLVPTMKHQHRGESAGMVFITCFMDSFLHQTPFGVGYRGYDRHGSVRLVIWDIQRLI